MQRFKNTMQEEKQVIASSKEGNQLTGYLNYMGQTGGLTLNDDAGPAANQEIKVTGNGSANNSLTDPVVSMRPLVMPIKTNPNNRGDVGNQEMIDTERDGANSDRNHLLHGDQKEDVQLPKRPIPIDGDDEL